MEKIVLDADVIINFSKANCLSLLADLVPLYECVVLDNVHDEINKKTRNELDNNINLLKKIVLMSFPQNAEMIREYAKLTKKFGKGESACMAYCRYSNNVVGSSNFKDVRDYCTDNGIRYVGTVDFLYYGISNGVIEKEEAERLLADMIRKGGKLPREVDFSTYIPTAVL